MEKAIMKKPAQTPGSSKMIPPRIMRTLSSVDG